MDKCNDNISNPLEVLKVEQALRSEKMKLEYRLKNKPNDINILDYTVIQALQQAKELAEVGFTKEVIQNYKTFEDELASKGITFTEVLEYVKEIEQIKEREKGCEFCNGETDLIDDDEATVGMSGDTFFYANWGGTRDLEWIACPKCGRKLGEDNE